MTIHPVNKVVLDPDLGSVLAYFLIGREWCSLRMYRSKLHASLCTGTIDTTFYHIDWERKGGHKRSFWVPERPGVLEMTKAWK